MRGQNDGIIYIIASSSSSSLLGCKKDCHLGSFANDILVAISVRPDGHSPPPYSQPSVQWKKESALVCCGWLLIQHISPSNADTLACPGSREEGRRKKMMLLRLFLLCSWLMMMMMSSAELLWPQPRFLESGHGPPIPVSPSFTISVPRSSSPELRLAAARYLRLVRKERWSPIGSSSQPQAYASAEDEEEAVQPLVLLNVTVTHDEQADLQHGVDESYTLVIPNSGHIGFLSAATPWGALHGLETFSQLVQLVQQQQQQQLVIEHGVRIVDKPMYAHRGILLDTSRNFYPVKDILRTIRALSYNKLNVFHWHITDSQSFPLFLESEPELSGKGSYGAAYTYSHHDVKRIVKYARSRGVRVVPEIDAPGHTASWGAAYPEIMTCLNKLWWNPRIQQWGERMASEPGAGQLNPLRPETYKVMANVINEVASLFPDELFHAGGDEVAPGCWNSSADIAQFIASGNGTMGDLLERFVAKTYPQIRAHNKTVIYWEDILLDATVNVSTSSLLPKSSTIIQTWNNGASNTKIVTAAGYRAIVSSSDFLYLDCGHGDFLLNDTRFDQPNASMTPASFNFTGDSSSFNYGGTGGSWCAPFKTWQRIYDYDLTLGLAEEEAALVVGAEAALWSEQADAAVLDARMWPRAAALAEMAWSGNRDAGAGVRERRAEAGTRLAEWRERMVGRGVAAEPMLPRWCLRNKGMCNINI